MFALLHSLGMFGVDLFKPRRRLEVENLAHPSDEIAQLSIDLWRRPSSPVLQNLIFGTHSRRRSGAVYVRFVPRSRHRPARLGTAYADCETSPAAPIYFP